MLCDVIQRIIVDQLDFINSAGLLCSKYETYFIKADENEIRNLGV